MRADSGFHVCHAFSAVLPVGRERPWSFWKVRIPYDRLKSRFASAAGTCLFLFLLCGHGGEEAAGGAEVTSQPEETAIPSARRSATPATVAETAILRQVLDKPGDGADFIDGIEGCPQNLTRRR